jgi:hypothetical protein
MPPESPKRSKRKAIPPCQNVELEFTRRFLSLFSSFYGTPSMDEILTFPPAPPSDVPRDPRPVPKIPPFHSGVWDLRLQKAIEARRKQDRETERGISDQVSQLNEAQTAEVPDLTEMFRAPKVDRPAIPLYIQNLRADRQAWFDEARNRVRPQRVDMNAAGALFKERIARQRALVKQRSQRRFARANEVARKHMDFVKGLHHSTRPADLDIKQAAKAREAARAAERTANVERADDIVRQGREIFDAIRDSPRRPCRSAILAAAVHIRS